MATWRSNMWIPILASFMGYQVHPYLCLMGLVASLIPYSQLTRCEGDDFDVEYKFDRNDGTRYEMVNGVKTEKPGMWFYNIIRGNTSVSETFSSDRHTDGSVVGLKIIWSTCLMVYFQTAMSNNLSIHSTLLTYAFFIFGILGLWMDIKAEREYPWSLINPSNGWGFRVHELCTLVHAISLGFYIITLPSVPIWIISYGILHGSLMFYFNLYKRGTTLGFYNFPFFVILEWVGYTLSIPFLAYYTAVHV